MTVHAGDRTQYRLDIPMVSRFVQPNSSIAFQSQSPTYSADMNLSTEEIAGSSSLQQSNSISVSDSSNVSLSRRQRARLSHSSSSTAIDLDRLISSNSPPMEQAQSVAAVFEPIGSSILGLLTPQQNQDNTSRRGSLGQAVAELVSTEGKFLAIKDRLLMHRDVFSDLASFSVEQIKEWIVENTQCREITALSCAKSIAAVFK